MSRMAAKLRAPTSISEVMASGRTEHSNRQQQRTWLSSPPALVLGNVQSSSEPPLIPTSRSSGGDCVFFQFPLFFLPTVEFNSGSLLWFRRCKAATRSGVKELVETKSYKPAIFGVGRSNLIADIDLNALIVEDHSSLSLDEYNPPIGVESDSLIVCNVRSSSFDGDHDDISDAIKEDSSITGSYV
nr:hypothetical protein Iba_chr15bCG9330 [Ipomoea batatas]